MEKLVRVVLRGKTVVQQYGVKTLNIIIIIIKKYPKVEQKIKDIVVAGMNTNPGGVPI